MDPNRTRNHVRIRLSFLLIFSLLLLGSMPVLAETSDSKNRRLLSEKLRKDAANWKGLENSKKRTFYLLGEEKLQFRLILEEGKDSTHNAEWLADRRGNLYRVSKSVVISEKDVEGILLIELNESPQMPFLIQVLFSRTSWDKIYERSADHGGKRLGIIRKGIVLSAPRLHEQVSHTAQVSGDFSPQDIDWFVHGFIENRSPGAEREVEYVRWMETRVENFPDDIKMAKQLAWVYENQQTEGCQKRIKLYKKVLLKDKDLRPSPHYKLLDDLHNCYMESKEYNDLIVFYKEIIKVKNPNLFGSSVQHPLAELYLLTGDKKAALEMFRVALDSTKMSLSVMKKKKMLPEGLLEKYTEASHQLINYLASRIEGLESAL